MATRTKAVTRGTPAAARTPSARATPDRATPARAPRRSRATPAPLPSTADFLARIGALHAQLADLLREPPRDAMRRAIHDGWRTHLAPRSSSVGSTLAALRRAQAWELDAAERALGLSAAGWRDSARALARLYVTLSGAHDGYARARVRWQQPMRLGLHKVPAAPIVRVGEHAKEREKQEKAAADLRKRMHERHEQALADVIADWRARQAGLQQALEQLRDLVVALCAAEEQRLAAAAAAQPGAPARLAALRAARIDLAHFVGTPAARFGTLLDRWLAARTHLAARRA